MTRAVAITHVGFEDLGTLEGELKHAGFQIEIFEAATANLRDIASTDPDLLIVLGGPIGVYEREAYPFLDMEIEWIRRRLMEKRPTLGICLGAQLIAAAAGASVFPGAKGKKSDGPRSRRDRTHRDIQSLSGSSSPVCEFCTGMAIPLIFPLVRS